MVLGISGYYHDSAAALVCGSEILAAAQEERFSRIKGDARFPRHAVQYCLESAGVSAKDILAVVYYDKPWLTFERILDSLVQSCPRGFDQFEMSLRSWCREKFFLKQILKRELRHFGRGLDQLLKFSEHHLSHAASAFYPSPFDSAAILTVDGVGEWATCTIGHGRGRKIEAKMQMNYPHSWGLVYAAFTQFLGFKVNSGEYKMMGLAPFASLKDPKVQEYKKTIQSELLTIHADGSLTTHLKQFEYGHGLRMINPVRWEKIFGIKARTPESPLKIEHAQLALAIQTTLEEGILRLAQTAASATGEKNLVMAGGVALNCVANGRLLREKIFESVWIQPAADDAGGALGAALAYSHLALGNSRSVQAEDSMRGSFLGPDFRDDEIEKLLSGLGLPFERMNDLKMGAKIASAIHAGKIVARFQGKMEWGPRALGNRSILARANDPDMQRRLNLSIKFRETFRPFAPMILEEDMGDVFEITAPSPYMLFTYPMNEKWRKKIPELLHLQPIGRQLQTIRSDFQAITHMDFSARVQTVNEKTNPSMADILKAYKILSGHSVIVNTSFNRRGEPIVCRPEEALMCFLNSGIDQLALGSFFLSKDKFVAEVIRNLPRNYSYSEARPLD